MAKVLDHDDDIYTVMFTQFYFNFLQLKMGRECISHYSLLHRFCVFSHDELVCKMSLEPDALDLTVAAATYQDMLQMVDCEKKMRKSLLEWVRFS